MANQVRVTRTARRCCALVPIVTAAFATAAFGQSAPTSLHDYEAAGPVFVAVDQIITLCVTNVSENSESVLLALVNASQVTKSLGILGSMQAQIAPQATACLNLPGANLLRNGTQFGIAALVVDGGFVDQGVIRQSGGIPGGGCIASLQIVEAQTGRTSLFAQTVSRHITTE